MSNKPKKIYLDIGHGGNDPGAVKYLNERKVAEQVIKYMNDYLLSHYNCQTKISKGSDSTQERSAEANSWKADVVFSCHLNAGGGNGFEVYLYSSSTKALGNAIWKEVKAIGQNAHGSAIKYDKTINMLRLPDAPACLTELCFVDNKKDSRDFDASAEWAIAGSAYAKGIANYMKLTKKSSLPMKVEKAKKVYSGKLPTLTVGKKYNRPKSTKLWQKFLNWALGLKLDIDGNFGPATQAATIKFQKSVGAYPDGIAGSVTYKYAKAFKK